MHFLNFCCELSLLKVAAAEKPPAAVVARKPPSAARSLRLPRTNFDVEVDKEIAAFLKELLRESPADRLQSKEVTGVDCLSLFL